MLRKDVYYCKRQRKESDRNKFHLECVEAIMLNDTDSSNGRGPEQKAKDKSECIIRESNTGLIDGNDEFYH